ncbi:hypothetical protein SynA1825c_01815 [Synechococcus sp. A18-25c]|nr:hypothetical protein SynA1825c_01815 [Synechococcus sp. A18-25c]
MVVVSMVRQKGVQSAQVFRGVALACEIRREWLFGGSSLTV